MKTIKFLAVAILATVSVYASASTMTQAKIKATAASGFYDQISLYEVAGTADDFSSSNNAPDILNTMNSWAVNMWAEGNSATYSAVEIPVLNNLVVKFRANAHETAYTISFSGVEGKALFLQKGTELIPMTEDYALTCAVNEEVTFTVVDPTANVYTRNVSNVWGTICLPQSVDADKITNATIYSVAGKTETELYLEEVTTGMVAGTPYIFKADAAGDVKFAYNNDAVDDPVAVTGLVGTFVDTYIGFEEMYVISNNVVRLATGTSTVKANRAYINLNEVSTYAPAPGRKLVPVRIANATTDIENAAEAAEIEKQIVNGQLLIRKAGVLYNVQGQIVK